VLVDSSLRWNDISGKKKKLSSPEKEESFFKKFKL